MNPFSQIFKYLSISLIFSLIGLIVGNMFIPVSVVYTLSNISSILIIVLLILALFSKKGMIPRRFSMNYVYLFTFIEGIFIYPLMNYYIYDLGIGMVISVLIATIIIFAGLSMYAKNNDTSKSLEYGRALSFILLGVIISSILNIFFKSSMTTIVISAISVLLFSFYIIYDINLIKRDIQYRQIADKDDLSIHVLNLYIDFINILLDLLRIVSKLDDKK